jgi:hypothetical protein
MKVDIDAYRLERFLESGHPRTMGMVLGISDKPADLFDGVQITHVTVNGETVDLTRRRSC